MVISAQGIPPTGPGLETTQQVSRSNLTSQYWRAIVALRVKRYVSYVPDIVLGETH